MSYPQPGCDFYECSVSHIDPYHLTARYTLSHCSPARQTAAGAYNRGEIIWDCIPQCPEPEAFLIVASDATKPDGQFEGQQIVLSLTRSNLVSLHNLLNKTLAEFPPDVGGCGDSSHDHNPSGPEESYFR